MAGTSLEIGQEAPDFDLKASTGDNVKLSQFRGDNAVALVFYPFTIVDTFSTDSRATAREKSRYEEALARL